MSNRLVRIALLAWLLLGAVRSPATAQTESGFPASTPDPVLADCTVRVTDDIEVPAKAPGVLVHLDVVRGSRVEKDATIGQVDDREAKMQKKVAEVQLRAAVKRAQDRIEIEYATKAAEVAREDYEQLEETNKIASKSVPESDLRRAKLDWQRSGLAIEKAAHDLELAEYDAHVRYAELGAAEFAISQRMITSPFSGEVVEIARHQGEWVNPGDPILRLVRLDVLYVDGKLDIARYDPQEISGCQVTVVVRAAKGETREATGRIIHVSPLVRFEGEYVYAVRAEISNELEGGHWRILPGEKARMTIHLGTAQVSVSRQ